eukprot:1860-Heterococcus_DN1.PRE.2
MGISKRILRKLSVYANGEAQFGDAVFSRTGTTGEPNKALPIRTRAECLQSLQNNIRRLERTYTRQRLGCLSTNDPAQAHCKSDTACYDSAKYYGHAVLAMLAFAVAHVSRKSHPIAFRKIQKNKGFDLDGKTPAVECSRNLSRHANAVSCEVRKR